MNLTPISGPRIAPTLGAKTVSSDAARSAAMAKFNEGLTAAASPSQEGAVLDPASKVADVIPTNDALPVTQGLNNEASSAVESAPSDLEAKRIASHYANLARKEKMLRIREAQFRQRMASASTPPTQTPAFDASKFVNRDELIANPFGVLNNLGLTYEQLTQKALDAPTAEDLQQRREIEALKTELKTLREGQDQVKKTFDDNQSLARQQAEMQIHQDVKRLISQDPTFEVTHAQNASHDVVRLITSVYDKGMGPEYPRGTILDISDAAAMVEQELTSRALRVAKLQKIQSQLNSNNVAKKPLDNNQQPAQQPTLRTLTNSVGTSTRKLSPRERALLAFRGETVA